MSQEVKHTPGPWGEKTVLVKGASWLATPHYDSEEARANAQLIVVAPDMLEALIEAERMFEHTWAMDGTVHKQMKAVIARATGAA